MGTAVVHKHGSLFMRGALLSALRTHNSTSAGSQDTSPRFVASYLMYGSTLSTPIPEVFVQDGQIRVPAVVLINGGARSGKELIAYAIKKAKLATFVGDKTAGACSQVDHSV